MEVIQQPIQSIPQVIIYLHGLVEQTNFIFISLVVLMVLQHSFPSLVFIHSSPMEQARKFHMWKWSSGEWKSHAISVATRLIGTINGYPPMLKLTDPNYRVWWIMPWKASTSTCVLLWRWKIYSKHVNIVDHVVITRFHMKNSLQKTHFYRKQIIQYSYWPVSIKYACCMQRVC